MHGSTYRELEQDELYLIMCPSEFPTNIEPPTRLSPNITSQETPVGYPFVGLSQPHDTYCGRCEQYHSTTYTFHRSPITATAKTSPGRTMHVMSQLTKALALSCLLCACRVQGFAFSQGQGSRSCRRGRPTVSSAVDVAGGAPHRATAAAEAAAPYRAAGWLASPAG